MELAGRSRLLPPVVAPPKTGIRFVHRGRLRRMPPRAVAPLRKLHDAAAPNDVSFREWLAPQVGDQAAAAISRAAAFFTYDYDPGRLSAAFVWERMRRLWRFASPTRFPIGGFGVLVDLLSTHARELGVTVECHAPVRELPPAPVVVATELRDAARLLRDDSLVATGAHSVLIDLGLRFRGRWPFSVLSLDDAAFAEHFSQRDPSLAPAGHSLIQAQAGIRPGETIDGAAERLEALLDVGFAGWRDRIAWRRRMLNDERSGAVDLPGATWRDRPAIERGGGVWLAGDMVAAPGLLGEVAVVSGADAGLRAAAALPAVRARSRRRSDPAGEGRR